MVVALFSVSWCQGAERKAMFPRLLGMHIREKNYQDEVFQQQLARLDIVILGFYRTWNPTGVSDPIRRVMRRLKALNPHMLIGQYTILNEAYDDPKDVASQDIREKITKEGWWLRDAGGNKRQWTSQYHAWDTNVTEWTRPDAAGLRLPQWMARRDYEVFFRAVPEFDIWYFDNVMWRQRIRRADWDLDGKDDNGDDPRIQAGFRRGEATEWEDAHKLAPGALLMGNPDNDLSFPEYRNKLHGAFLEGLMGHSWSIEKLGGWPTMMERYHAIFANLLRPKIVGFDVYGSAEDYQFFRYAYASCLLDDGYFSFTDSRREFKSVPWFDEYDAKLGVAIDFPQIRPWRGGVYRRRFDRGVVFVNPTDHPETIEVGRGYRRIAGKQAPNINNGEQAGPTMVLPARDGIVLLSY